MAYQQVTLAALQTLLALRVDNKPWWTAAEATRAINEGLRIWNAATGFWRGKAFVTTVPNDPWVAVPSTLVRSARVLWNGIPLERASQVDLDYGIPNWRAATTTSGGSHPTRPVYWAPASLTLLLIYPADATGLNALEIDGVRQTPILAAAADYLDLNQADLDRFLAYAQHVLAVKVGGPTLIASYPGWLGFLQACAAENRAFAASTFYRRALGLDQQRRFVRKAIPVENPVDQAVEVDQQNQPGVG